ncbi:hypothetical protein [Lysinibacillus sp. 3P01SB]|uniref:hypothetical protein n=1 Tax=Lysinibacillus sp. 3P01SB TaxID=3132284 RepID=UPI0039A53355
MEQKASEVKTSIDGEGMNEREQLVDDSVDFPADCCTLYASAGPLGYQKDDETIGGNH